MFQDYKDLLSVFNARGVRYLIVGGYAVSFHAQPRGTKDIDIFIRADTENARMAYSALAEFGAPLTRILPEDLADRGKFFRFGYEPRAIDILPSIDGVAFDEAWEKRIQSVVDEATGLTAFFISKEDLIATKLATGRLQDLADVQAIKDADDSRSPSVPN